MSKHLSIKEKLNAKNELIQNRAEIIELKKRLKATRDTTEKYELICELQNIKKRNKKLENHIISSKRSVHNGRYGINGVCYNVFGKKACELTREERTEYNRIMKKQQRIRTGSGYDREYYKKYHSTHKEKIKERKSLWALKNKDKIKQNYLKRKLEKQKQRGYGPYEGTWTYKTFGKHYKDMTEEEKIIRRKIYNQTVRKEKMKSE